MHLLVFSGTRPPVDVLDPSSGEARASTLEVYQVGATLCVFLFRALF